MNVLLEGGKRMDKLKICIGNVCAKVCINADFAEIADDSALNKCMDICGRLGIIASVFKRCTYTI